ncbi:MAG: hypothetical protein ACLR1V_16095 [Coprococcus sp.]
MSLNKEKANALNAYRMIQNMLLVSKDMNQRLITYTLNQLASQNDSMWKGIRLKQTGSRNAVLRERLSAHIILTRG